MASVYDFTVKDIHGKPVKLDRFRGVVHPAAGIQAWGQLEPDILLANVVPGEAGSLH